MSRRHEPIRNIKIESETEKGIKSNLCVTRQMTKEEWKKYGKVNKDYKLRGNFNFDSKAELRIKNR